VKKHLIVLLLVALSLAESAYSQPLRISGAKVLPKSSILAWGELLVNNTMLPIIMIIDSAGQVRDALYFAVPNTRVVILDALEEEGRIVVGGLVEKGRRREAFAASLSNKAVDWAFSLQQDLYFVKALAKSSSGYTLLGLTSGVSDSDIAVVYIDEKASIQRALRIGCPMYDDFVEKAFTFKESLLLIGSTWCQNVSYVDALLVNVTDESLQSITIGGAAYDEGLAAKVLNGKTLLVGSSFTSPGGLSDAYLAFLNDAGLKVLAVGWQSYDGFVDICGGPTDFILLGYATMEGRSVGLLVRVNENEVASGLLIEGEESVVPLAIGFGEEKLATVFKDASGLILITFDPDLKPLAAFSVGESNLTTIRVRKVRSLERKVYDISDIWKVQRMSLAFTPIEVSVNTLYMEVHPISLVSRPLRIEVGEYVEEVPLTKLLVRIIEQNIPLLVILLPLLAIVLAIVAARRPR